ncbi:MAG: sodium:solute symporter, partial [Planctomycetota bacterium]|nr:sodium:solute symporter [Planctomycetota bacterium]
MSRLPAIDIVVLVVYLASIVAFGCWFARKSRGVRAFTTAGGALPAWAVGLSIFGTFLSSNTFLGVPGKAFGGNWAAFVFSLSLPIVALVAVRYFVPFYRRSGSISAYEHLEKRFGGWARTYAVIGYLLMQVARVGSIMLGMALVLHALTGWSMAAIILITGALVTLYTLLGGIEAVIWTDVIQSIVLTAGALGIALLLMFGMPGGPGELVSFAAKENKFSLGGFSPDPTVETFWVVLLYGMFINLGNFGIDQNYVQRYHAARSERAAVRSVWLGAILYIPISALFFFIGSSLFSYYHAHPKMLAEVRTQVATQEIERRGDEPTAERVTQHAALLSDRDIGDSVLPHFIAHGLPTGLAGLLIAAVVAAAMSSIDTSLNSSATVILSDIYRRYVRPSAGEAVSMRVLRVSTVLFGAVGTGAALALIDEDSVLDA